MGRADHLANVRGVVRSDERDDGRGVAEEPRDRELDGRSSTVAGRHLRHGREDALDGTPAGFVGRERSVTGQASGAYGAIGERRHAEREALVEYSVSAAPRGPLVDGV